MIKRLIWRMALAGLTLISSAAFAQAPSGSPAGVATVGRTGGDNAVLPVNQVVTPAGEQIELRGLRPQVLALSPDGRLLVTAGKTRELVVVDADSGRVTQKLSLPADGSLAPGDAAISSHYLKPDKTEQVSYTGLVFSPDGSRLYLSNVKGSLKVFAINAEHRVRGLGSIALPPANAPERQAEIPAGLAVSADGRRLYVAGNLSNRLLEFQLPEGRLLRTFEVGALPYGVVLAGRKAYVSNWGGRRPEGHSNTGPAGRGTWVRVDSRGIANDGSVSVIDLNSGKKTAEISTGLHPGALLLTPDRRYVCVANANSDTVSVISTRSDRVVETILVRWQAQDLFGASPNALAMSPAGKMLYVCNGTQNAVAVIAFHPGKRRFLGMFPAGKPGNSKLLGLIPTGWYPGALAYDRVRKKLYVANLKGTLPDRHYDPGRSGYNSHQYLGTLSLIPLPDPSQLQQDTLTVLRNYRRAVEENVFAPTRSGQPPRPVPERIGEPSVFKHVVYLIKENRTYDQVLGDVKAGNGDARLCVFGGQITPNQHKMVHDFVLLDNTYCCGILSADGHQWADSAFATDYMEKSFADFPRSYPDMLEADDLDAMAYSSAGFIWDNAAAHGVSVRNYGECSVAVTSWKDPSNHKPLRFLDYYHDFINRSGLINYRSEPGVNTLRTCTMTNTVGWNLSIPDVFRASRFIGEFKEFEACGEMPQLSIICLPNDHTSGTDPGAPTPAAQVADNDLAFGQIVDAISHSRFWKDTCIFAIEDDPQSGWDHVSGYRTTAYVVSPYTKRNAVVRVNYNQTSVLRTLELMLGLPPMNQMDATATPMTACFTDRPDFTPFDCVTNRIPLDQMNPEVSDIKDHRQLRDAITSSRLPWEKPDACPDGVLNRILWHAQKGFRQPYPLWAITESDDD